MLKKLKPLEQVLIENPHEKGTSYKFNEGDMIDIVCSMEEKFGNYVNVEIDHNCYRDIEDLWVYHPKWFNDK